MEVRSARAADLEALAGLLLAVYRSFGEALPPQADLTAFLRKHLARPDQLRFLVAEQGGELLGLASLAFAPTTAGLRRFAWLDDVHVAERHRAKGIGRLLVRAALDLARELGATEVRLTFPAGEPGLATFYRRLGFVPLPVQMVAASVESGRPEPAA